ncbi:hypothetical protein AURDEDRAFT_172751 [Auricularia subglabra TFB-10046 SS5]|nr:hypothetical protein AURDEDRAFT_172751 [Auricularia subglabra TFB-10046 SS5]
MSDIDSDASSTARARGDTPLPACHAMPHRDSDASSVGASWEQLRDQGPPPENHIIWKKYREHASDSDEKLCKRWHETCDVLLVFAALFSAVLTAFLVESSKAFDPDYGKYTAHLLYTVLSHQNGSATFRFPPADLLKSPTVHVTPPILRAVNWLWYASLFLSLGACVMCLWAKQWLDNYEARVNAGFDSLRHWARRRALYHQGTAQWDLTGFIMALPLVMHIAVCLFFAGLALSLLPEDTGVAGLVFALSLILLSIYTLTGVVAVWRLESPWGTPLLRRFENLVYRTWHSLFIWARSVDIAGSRWPRTTAILRKLLDFAESFLGAGDSYTSQEQSATIDMDPVALGWLMRSTHDEDVQFEALHMIGALLHSRSRMLSGRLGGLQSDWAGVDQEHREFMSEFSAADAAYWERHSQLSRSASASAERASLIKKRREASQAVRSIAPRRAYVKSAIRDTREEVRALVTSLESGDVADLDQLPTPRNIAELSCDPYVRRAALRFCTRTIDRIDVRRALLDATVDERQLRSLCTVFSLAPFIRFEFDMAVGYGSWTRILDQLKTTISVTGRRSWVYDFIDFVAAATNELNAPTGPLNRPGQSAWEMLISESPESANASLFPLADLIVQELRPRNAREGPDVTAWRATFCGSGWDISRLLVSAFTAPATTISPFLVRFKEIYEDEQTLRGDGETGLLKDWNALLRDALDVTVDGLFTLSFLGNFSHVTRPGVAHIALRASEAEEMRLLTLGVARSVHALERVGDPPCQWESSYRFPPYVIAVISVLPLEDDLSDDASRLIREDDVAISLEALESAGDSRIRSVSMTLDTIVPFLLREQDHLLPRKVEIGLNDTAVLARSPRTELQDFLRDTKLLVWPSAREADGFAKVWAARPLYLQNVIITWATIPKADATAVTPDLDDLLVNTN